MKAPKEIWIDLDGMTAYSLTKTEGKTKYNPITGIWHNFDDKYISEQHHNEQIEVLKKEIEELKRQLRDKPL